MYDAAENGSEEKQKFPRSQAIPVAREIVQEIGAYCLTPAGEDKPRLIVAGSLRRKKMEVGDIELVYVPVMVEGRKTDLFASPTLASAVDVRLDYLLERGVLAKRLNARGSETWGEKNKLAVHIATGIPIDFFATTVSCWWNYLVCRTGPSASNIRIAEEAKKLGFTWRPYQGGFEDESKGIIYLTRSEREVFEFVGLRWCEPWERK